MEEKDIRSQLEALIVSAQTPTDIAIRDIISLIAIAEIQKIDKQITNAIKHNI